MNEQLTKHVSVRMPMHDWQAIASLVIMDRATGTTESVPKWIIEACRQRLERDYPNISPKEGSK